MIYQSNSIESTTTGACCSTPKVLWKWFCIQLENEKKPRELSMEYLNFNWSSPKTQSQMASATFRAKLLRQSLVNSLTIWLANKKMKKKKYYSIVEIPQMRLLLNAIFAESLMSHFSYFYVVCVLKLGIKLTKHPRNAISEAPPTSPFLALSYFMFVSFVFFVSLFLYSIEISWKPDMWWFEPAKKRID